MAETLGDLQSMKETALIRILDDEAEVREALSILLSCAGWKTMVYGSAAHFLEEDDLSWPGCLILDVLMPGMNGMSLQTELIRRHNQLPVIFVTGHGEVGMAVEAMRRGAVHFLEKPVCSEALFAAVEEACRQSLASMKKEPLLDEERIRSVCAELTVRQREVLYGVLHGYTARDIGERLGISHRTVLGHRAVLNRLFGIQSPEDLEALKAKLFCVLEDLGNTEP